MAEVLSSVSSICIFVLCCMTQCKQWYRSLSLMRKNTSNCESWHDWKSQIFVLQKSESSVLGSLSLSLLRHFYYWNGRNHNKVDHLMKLFFSIIWLRYGHSEYCRIVAPVGMWICRGQDASRAAQEMVVHPRRRHGCPFHCTATMDGRPYLPGMKDS